MFKQVILGIFFLVIAVMIIGLVVVTQADAVEYVYPTKPPKDNTTERIWELLRQEMPETATAAILGNIKHESAVCPYRFSGYTIEESRKLADYRVEKKSRFIYGNECFGLAQWCGGAQLKKLWNFCEENGYKVDSVEGQIAFLLYDLKDRHPMCYERLLRYQPEDLITATEDFRQSYERSICEERDKWCRATYAQEMFTLYCKEVTDIKRIATLPFEFDIYEKVQMLNKEIENA